MKNPFIAVRSSPELTMLGSLLVWNGAVWFLTQGNVFSPRLAILAVGLIDAFALLALGLRMLLARRDRFGFWHLYSTLAGVSFGVYGASGLPELDDGAWVGNVLLAFAFLKLGLLAMWVAGAAASKSQHTLRSVLNELGDWLAGRGIKVAWSMVALRWALQILAFRQGIVISGTSGHMAELGFVSTVGVMLLPLSQIASMTTEVLVACHPAASRRRIWVALVAIELLGAAVFSGRRTMLAMVCLALIVWRLCGRSRMISVRATVVGAAALVAMIGVAWPFFFHMRTYAMNQEMLSSEAYGDRLSVFVNDILPAAFATFSLRDSYSGDSDYVENVASRATVSGYFAEIIEATSEGSPAMMGEVFAAIFQANVPKAIWKDKPEIDVEDQVNAHFGLPRVDAPSTYAAQAYADFGVPGIIFYYAVFGAFLAVSMRYAGTSRFLITRIFVLAIACSTVFEIEAELTSLMSCIRWLVIAVIVDAIAAGVFMRGTKKAVGATSSGQTLG